MGYETEDIQKRLKEKVENLSNETLTILQKALKILLVKGEIFGFNNPLDISTRKLNDFGFIEEGVEENLVLDFLQGISAMTGEEIILEENGIKHVGLFDETLSHLRYAKEIIDGLLGDVNKHKKRRIITKSKDGEYFYKNIKLRLSASSTLSYNLFKILYDNSNNVVPYEEIGGLFTSISNKKLKGKEARQRIRNAKTALLNDLTGNTGLRPLEIIDKQQNIGLKLINPEVV